MSRGSVVAKRYARALFELARDRDLVAAVETELKIVVDAFGGQSEIQSFLNAPNITIDKKLAALRSAFGGNISDIVLNTVSLLLERGRQSQVAVVLQAYRQVAGGVLGRADAEVTSAKALTETQQETLANKFGALIGKSVRVSNTVDPTILGGLTVRIGDTLYDGSLRSKLDRLSKQLQTSV